MSNKYLIVILRFHGDVLLTKPMIDNIKLNDPDGEIDLLLYKGTGSILEHEKSLKKDDINDIDKLTKFCNKESIDVSKYSSIGEIQFALFEKIVESNLLEPTFITEYPIEVSPLARVNNEIEGISTKLEEQNAEDLVDYKNSLVKLIVYTSAKFGGEEQKAGVIAPVFFYFNLNLSSI